MVFISFLNTTLRFSLHSEHLLILVRAGPLCKCVKYVGSVTQCEREGELRYRMCSPFLDEDHGGEDGRAEDDGGQNTDNG